MSHLSDRGRNRSAPRLPFLVTRPPWPALLNGGLDLDAVLGSSDFELLPELSRQLGDDLFPVAGAAGELMGDALLMWRCSSSASTPR